MPRWNYSSLHSRGYRISSTTIIVDSQKQNANNHHTILEVVYNKQLSRGRNVVKNTFEFLNKTLKELLVKSNLLILFILDVIACCCTVYILILNGWYVNVNALMLQLV